MAERQLVDPRELQDLREIKAGDCLLRLPVIEVLNYLATGLRESTVCVCECFGKCIGGDDAQAVRRCLSSHQLQRVISGISHRRIIVDQSLKLRKRLDGCGHAGVVVIVLEIWIRQPGNSETGEDWTINWVRQVRRQIVGEKIS